jgi:methionyl-tRNA formyltransferase
MGITDWHRPARSVHDWIRALTAPYPGAFTFIAGRKLMLWASVADGVSAWAGRAAGEVLGCDEEGIRVATGDGAITLTSVSDPGEAPGPAFAWAGRNGLRPGDEFEPVPWATAAWALGDGPRPAEDRTV